MPGDYKKSVFKVSQAKQRGKRGPKASQLQGAPSAHLLCVLVGCCEAEFPLEALQAAVQDLPALTVLRMYLTPHSCTPGGLKLSPAVEEAWHQGCHHGNLQGSQVDDQSL